MTNQTSSANSLYVPSSDATRRQTGIKDELVGRIDFDDQRVFRQLGKSNVLACLVNALLPYLHHGPNISEARQLLKDICVSNENERELAAEMEMEVGMYKPLVRVLLLCPPFFKVQQWFIESHLLQNRNFSRLWATTKPCIPMGFGRGAHSEKGKQYLWLPADQRGFCAA